MTAKEAKEATLRSLVMKLIIQAAEDGKMSVDIFERDMVDYKYFRSLGYEVVEIENFFKIAWDKA